MQPYGIHGDDLVVIDRSLEPRSGDVVVAAHQGAFLMRPLRCLAGTWQLVPLRPAEESIPIDMDAFERSGLFGVVVHVVHHLAAAPSRRR